MFHSRGIIRRQLESVSGRPARGGPAALRRVCEVWPGAGRPASRLTYDKRACRPAGAAAVAFGSLPPPSGTLLPLTRQCCGGTAGPLPRRRRRSSAGTVGDIRAVPADFQP